MLKVENLNKKFGKKNVLKDINFEVNNGDIIAIVGPSGSGKSTLLRCLNMIERPTSGKINFDKYNVMNSNINLNKYRMNVGMVFQQFNLFPHMTVLENITLVPVKLGILNENDAKKKAEILLEDIGLIKINQCGIIPGLGVDKNLSMLGDISIIAVVSEKQNALNNLSNNTRLNFIYTLSKRISTSIIEYLKIS